MREKVRERKAGSLIVFVVDSSGSMGAAKRMSEAKGAVLALLNDAYQKRDMVSLVAFKGNDAFVALNPTGSIELAKKNLEDIPTGGKTPLSSGMGAGLHVINRELQKNPRIKPLMVLISDGRGNVSFRNNTPFEEAKEIAADIKSKGIGSIVIDTESGLVRLGRLGELAEIMGGKYYGIDDLRSDRIHSIVRENI
jgi:magnesium chelatase subunit D